MNDPVAHGEALRARFPAVIGALICVHASMAATRVTASLLAMHLGYPAWVVGLLLSLFAVAPIGLSLWAGRLAGATMPAAPMWLMGAMVLLAELPAELPASRVLPASAPAPT